MFECILIIIAFIVMGLACRIIYKSWENPLTNLMVNKIYNRIWEWNYLNWKFLLPITTFLCYTFIILFPLVCITTLFTKEYIVSLLSLFGTIEIFYFMKTSLPRAKKIILKGNFYFSCIKHENKQEFDKVIETCNNAIKNNIDISFFYVERAEMYIIKNEYKKAIDDLTKAIELVPNNKSYYKKRASLYEKTNEYDNAHKDYKKASELNTNIENTYNQNINISVENIEKPHLIKDIPQQTVIQNSTKDSIININNCTMEEILTLNVFTYTKAKKIIEDRDNGKMWYDLDTLVKDFELQPHEMLMIQDRIKFPNKPKNKYGRKLDI